jgi:hypothetical protein
MRRGGDALDAGIRRCGIERMIERLNGGLGERRWMFAVDDDRDGAGTGSANGNADGRFREIGVVVIAGGHPGPRLFRNGGSRFRAIKMRFDDLIDAL